MGQLLWDLGLWGFWDLAMIMYMDTSNGTRSVIDFVEMEYLCF